MSAVALLQRGPAADRPRHRPRHERQHLPLRHLCPHPRRHQGRGAHAGGLSHDHARPSASPAAPCSRAPPASSSASICRPAPRKAAVRRSAGLRPGRRHGRVRAQRLRAHRRRRHGDGARQAHRVRPGAVHRASPRWSPRSWTPTGRKVRAEHAPVQSPSSTRTSPSACRAPAARRPSPTPTSRCARPARRRAPCWSQAAAQAWRVPAGEITVERGVLRHAQIRAHRAGSAQFAEAAAQLPVPAERAAQGPGDVPADRPRGRGQEARQRRQVERHGAVHHRHPRARTC